LRSARVSRAGERVLADGLPWFLFTPGDHETKEKFVSARRRNQHARDVRYPIAVGGTSAAQSKFARR
jgi:hypothetical protein